MNSVETVRGSIPVPDLGRTYMHEHIFVLTPDMQNNYPYEWGSTEARIQEAAIKLNGLVSQGVRTFVDLTVVGLGRNIPLIQRVAQKVPELNIVIATGIYTYDQLPLFYRFRQKRAGYTDPMVDLFVRDIEDGVGNTGIKAAILKCAVDKKGLTPGVERVLRAVATAHHRTGVPITVHTHPESHSAVLVRKILCEEEGVRPHHIVLAHCGDTVECDYLTELAESGFTLGMDRFGIYTALSFENRIDTVVELCRRGFSQQMVMSHDAASYIDWLDDYAMSFLPKWNYRHIGAEVLPALKERGVSDEQIEDMLVRAPAKVFNGR